MKKRQIIFTKEQFEEFQKFMKEIHEKHKLGTGKYNKMTYEEYLIETTKNPVYCLFG